MPDFDVKLTVTVVDVDSPEKAVAVVQSLLNRLGDVGTVFHPVPADVVESEPR
jgi:hypothetical protein